MAAAVASRDRAVSSNDIFHSVFAPVNHTTPTPEATPDLGTVSPGRPFGGFNVPPNAVDGAVLTARAWSVATRYLTLNRAFQASPLQQEDVFAFEYLLGAGQKAESLIAWYIQEIRPHYVQEILPKLHAWQEAVLPRVQASNLVTHTARTLQSAQHEYLDRIHSLVRVKTNLRTTATFEHFLAQVRRKWHALLLHSLPKHRLQKVLASAFYQHILSALANGCNPESCLKKGRCDCQITLDSLPLHAIHTVGLDNDLGERALALAVHKILDGPGIERRCFQVDWSGQNSVMSRVRVWVSECFAIAVQRGVADLTGNPTFAFSDEELQRMALMAVSNLGRKRTAAILDYVKVFPASTGALLDVKEYISTGPTSEKILVCSSFSDQVRHRLLHAGASTAEILSIYVKVIHAFRLLDARGVLLEKVALPIRGYLRTRDDTVSIIAESFLADIDESGEIIDDDDGKVCAAVASEVEGSLTKEPRNDSALSWDDMDWVPDPIDAGPNHKFTKNEDVLSYVLGLFDQEDFIKEVTSVLAQHLLQSHDPDFARATRLVELFKTRFDPSKLQAAEVMLKDVRDSVLMEKRIFAKDASSNPPTPQEIQAAIPADGITLSSLWPIFEGRMGRAQFLASVRLVANRRGDIYLPKRSRLPSEPTPKPPAKSQQDFGLMVLSSFFWPQLRTNDFRTLSVFDSAHEKASQKFSEISGQRKLEYRPALARVSLTLDFEDRSISENNLPAWRAVVIDAFASEREKLGLQDQDAGEGTDIIEWTVAGLQEHLSMEVELVQDALSFWGSKRVLYQRSPGQYAVLERLDMDINEEQTPAEDAAFSGLKSQDSMLRENAPMFEAFIANMLRNGGPKEIGGMMGIAGMLKMVLPLFTYGEEEVRWLLGQMEGRGEVARDGELWAATK